MTAPVRPYDHGGMTPAEHLEAFLEQMAHLGWTSGAWEFTFSARDGRLRRVVPHPVQEPHERTESMGRRELDEHQDAA